MFSEPGLVVTHMGGNENKLLEEAQFRIATVDHLSTVEEHGID